MTEQQAYHSEPFCCCPAKHFAAGQGSLPLLPVPVLVPLLASCWAVVALVKDSLGPFSTLKPLDVLIEQALLLCNLAPLDCACHVVTVACAVKLTAQFAELADFFSVLQPLRAAEQNCIFQVGRVANAKQLKQLAFLIAENGKG
jgi:hypothetical protein